MMNYNEFKSRLMKIKTANSVKGKAYTGIVVQGDNICYTRESGSNESISIKKLYDVYNTCDYVNTNILRNYITGRKFSPSLAILIESGLYDRNGQRI